MRNKNWFKSKRQQQQTSGASITSLLRKTLRLGALLGSLALLSLLAASLGGCATTCPPPPEPVFPPKPALVEPLPLVTYSLSAQTDTEQWRRKLTVTPATPKP